MQKQNWEVTLWRTVDFVRDVEKDEGPELSQETFTVFAEDENEAVRIASAKVNYSIWESAAEPSEA